MPERDVLECRDGVAAIEARHATDALAVDRVALMRHRRRALLPRGEILLRLADIRTLEVAHLRRDFLERRGADRDRRDELRVAVALDDLRCEPHRREAELLADHLLDLRINIRIRTDGARELADGDDFLRVLDTLDVALDLRAPEQELQAERHRLRVDAVRAADARRMLELHRAAAQHLVERLEILEDDVAGVAHHHAVGRILHIRGRQSLVDVLGVITDMLRYIRQERDDVMMRYRLDLVDAIHLERRLRAYVLGRFLWDLAELRHGVAGSHLDIQYLLPLVLDRPEMPHLRSGVTFNHQ